MTNPECAVIEEASEVQSTTESDSFAPVVPDDVSFEILAENLLTETLIDTGLMDFALCLPLTLFPLVQPQGFPWMTVSILSKFSVDRDTERHNR